MIMTMRTMARKLMRKMMTEEDDEEDEEGDDADYRFQASKPEV